MDSARWKNLKVIFTEAAELPDAERAVFLEGRCAGDAALRSEIEKMLAADAEDTGGLSGDAFELFNGKISESLPEYIGKYRILSEVGRGGMGAVYEGVFETVDFSQRVALKVIKRGMDTDQIVRRFRHEQKILASLVHPNIAQFLDGGMTADDLPFYAMEFVEGRPIDEFCAEENLSLEKRLAVFRQVCSAVGYAHQNLVVHRDLKPQNILVTADGTPKLLDFGIGKILNPDAGEEPGTATQLGMMTPAYASPEQVLGKRIGTASDIYSLGVILYELLTGGKPYKFSANSQLEIERAVCESDPVRPSVTVKTEGDKRRRGEQSASAFSPSPLLPFSSSQLRGDLDNIILKCLRKEPADRYASVQELSEDIRRYLDGLPVMARPHTISYRASKFVRRNRVGVAAAALIFLSLCVGITAAVWQARRAEQQRLIAEKRFADVRQLANNVVFKYHDAIAALPGSTAAREMLVSDALAYLDQLAGETADDVDLQAELAAAYLKMGDVQGKMYSANVGNTEGALRSYEKSIELFESVVENEPANIEAKDRLIEAYDNLAFLMLRTRGHDSAQSLVERALALYEQIPKTESGSKARTLRLIDLYIRIGDTRGTARFDALADRRKALPLIEELLRSDPNDYETIKGSARIFQRMGTDHYWLGRYAEDRGETEAAKTHFAESLGFQQRSLQTAGRLAELAPDRPESHRYVAASLGNLAESLAAAGQTDEALDAAEKFRITVEKTLRDDPNNRETQLTLSDVYEAFANIYSRRGDEPQVIANTLKALAIDDSIYRADNKNMEVLGRVVQRNRLLADIYAKQGDAEKAEFHRRAIAKIETETSRKE